MASVDAAASASTTVIIDSPSVRCRLTRHFPRIPCYPAARLTRETLSLSRLDSSAETDESAVAAGPFGDWLARFRASLRETQESEVPCGDCTGCCISGYSVQVRRQDERARGASAPKLLVQRPDFARGDLTMAPRPDGVCPMLNAGQCTIYEDRPADLPRL